MFLQGLTERLMQRQPNNAPMNACTAASSAAVRDRVDALVPNLLFGGLSSESDEPVRSVIVTDKVERMDRKQLSRAFGPLDSVSRSCDGNDLTERMLRQIVAAHPESAVGARAAGHARDMCAELRQLAQLTVAIGSERPGAPSERPVFLVGRATDGCLVGIQSKVIWS